MAPAMLNALLKSNTLDQRDVSSIRSILCGSAPLDPWMITGFKERYGIEIVNAFGSTEGMTFMSGPTITVDPLDSHLGFSFGVGHAEADVDRTIELLLELPAKIAAERKHRTRARARRGSRSRAHDRTDQT